MNGWLDTKPLIYSNISNAYADVIPPGRVKSHVWIPNNPVSISTIVTPYEIFHEILSESNLKIENFAKFLPTLWSHMPTVNT